MAQTMTRAQMKAAANDTLYAALSPRELLRGLGEVIHRKVALTSIQRNPDQPRSSVDEESPEFEDLVGSIRAQGLIQPISLWQVDDDSEVFSTDWSFGGGEDECCCGDGSDSLGAEADAV